MFYLTIVWEKFHAIFNSLNFFFFGKPIRCRWTYKNQKPIKIDVFQGFFALPILFMFLTASFFKIFQGNNKKMELRIREYMDDGLLIARAIDEIKSVLLIQEAFEKVEL